METMETETGNAPTLKASDLQFLDWVYDEMSDGLLSRSYSNLAAEQGCGKKGIKGMVERLESAGFLKVERQATPFLYKKTRPGETLTKIRGRVGNDGNDIQKQRTVQPKANVHDLGIEFYLSEKNMMMEKSRESILGNFDFLQYDKTNGEYYGDWDRYHFRISGKKVVIYRRGEEKGLSATYVKETALQDFVKCREFLEEELNLDFNGSAVIEGKVISQDVSIEDHPLIIAAQNAGAHITPERFNTKDSRGNVRLKLDLSHGENGELEAEMRGNLSSNARMEESDIQRELDDIFWRANNPEKWDKVKEYGEDREIIMQTLGYLLDQEERETEPKETTVSDAFTITSRWIDQHGNLMGYVQEAGKPVKLKDSEDLP